MGGKVGLTLVACSVGCSVHCPCCSVGCSVHCPCCSVGCSVLVCSHSRRGTLQTAHYNCILHTKHHTLHTIHHLLYNAHYTLHTSHNNIPYRHILLNCTSLLL